MGTEEEVTALLSPVTPHDLRRWRDSGEIVVGAAFRNGDGCDVADLLAAFAQAHGTCGPLALVIVGDGPERTLWQMQAADIGIAQRVHFVGAQDDAASWVSAFDIFALPCQENAIPVALMEAMAAGVAVIVNANERLRGLIIEGLTGCLVPAGDNAAMARTIVALAKDQSRRGGLGIEAQKYMRKMYGTSLFAARAAYGYINHPKPSFARQACKRLLTAALPKRALLTHGRRDCHQFALTFDDGPDPVYTPKILNLLATSGVNATFFLVGNRAEEHPNLVRRIAEEGHEVANHSYSHPYFQKIAMRAAVDEVAATAVILNRLQRQRCRLFRPPFGLSVQSLLGCWKTNHQMILWSVDLKDYRATDKSDITSRLAHQPIANGDIILYHGTNPSAVAALPAVIAAATAAGRKGVVVSNLAL